MYYVFQYQLERGGNVSTVIGRNKEQVEKERKRQKNYVREGGTVAEIEKIDKNWISVNPDYEPVQVVGVEGDAERTFYYYISKSKNAHVFISTNKEELDIEEVSKHKDTQILTDGIEKFEGQMVSVETEYSPFLE